MKSTIEFNVPSGVRAAVVSALKDLKSFDAAMVAAELADKNFCGFGRYVQDTIIARGAERDSAQAVLREFRIHAPGNGVDADAYIEMLKGGV